MTIKAGDLVMVVRGSPCCGRLSGAEGTVFTVSGLSGDFDTCKWCLAHYREFSALGSKRGGIRVSRLIKIDPPSLPESITEREELEV